MRPGQNASPRRIFPRCWTTGSSKTFSPGSSNAHKEPWLRTRRAAWNMTAHSLRLRFVPARWRACPTYWDALGDLEVPITLVAGSLDQKYCAIHERALTRLPQAAGHVVSGVGHNVLLEAPNDLARILSPPEVVQITEVDSTRAASRGDSGRARAAQERSLILL